MNVVTATKQYKLSKGGFYYIFTFLFLLHSGDYVDRMVVISLSPFIQKGWSFTDTRSGMLVSVVFWSIGAFEFPVSVLVERWGQEKTISIREVRDAPVGTVMLSGVCPPEKRSRMLASVIQNLQNAPSPNMTIRIVDAILEEAFGSRNTRLLSGVLKKVLIEISITDFDVIRAVKLVKSFPIIRWPATLILKTLQEPTKNSRYLRF